ncbi:MAG: hypothetical protein LBR43_00785 [Spiroplasmataceae bacterium]|jgi:hypothetical protein|nr:hypothetical protein [Spiroplasmataceae bacterium]
MSKILEEITNNNTNSQTNSLTEQEPNLMAILGSVLTPLIPVFVAKLTGQKLPMTSLIPQSPQQDPLEKLTPILQSMINTQNVLLQEIAMLKKNDQIFQTFRLTHEKKQIDFNPNQNLENNG